MREEKGEVKKMTDDGQEAVVSDSVENHGDKKTSRRQQQVRLKQ